MTVAEVEGRYKSFYFVPTLVSEKAGNFKVDLLCEPCTV